MRISVAILDLRIYCQRVLLELKTTNSLHSILRIKIVNDNCKIIMLTYKHFLMLPKLFSSLLKMTI